MKKLFHPVLFVVLVLLFGLTACSGGRAQRLPQNIVNEAVAAPANEEALANGETPAQAGAGDAAIGKELFTQTCSACHGPTGEGVQGLGKDMTHSEFIAGKSDADLIAFIKVGRDPSDPLNTTGVAMPPKGGNPTLDDADLQDLVAFIRSIHQ